MKSNYARCLAFVLKYEGGKVDDPQDPGGRTNQGVTQATYDGYRRRKGLLRRDVYVMENVERDEIYKTQYWDAVDGDDLPAGTDLVMMDFAVNSGPKRAKDFAVKVGGVGKPAAVFVAALCDARLAWLKSLKTWARFGRGWGARVNACRKLGLSMAAQPVDPPVPPPVVAQPKVVPQVAKPAPQPKSWWQRLFGR